MKNSALFRMSDYFYYMIKNPFIEKVYRHLYYGKEKKSFRFSGEYEDKVFFVIRVRYDDCGVMAYFRYVLCKIAYAVSQGYIPVVDMQNGKNAYLNYDEVGRDNSWEYFFDQPAGYTLEDIVQAKNIIFSSLAVNEPDNFYCDEIYEVAKKYIRFNKEIENKIQKVTYEWEENEIQNVLGLKLRGTDYVATRPSFHAMQPTIEEFIHGVDEKIKETGKKIDLFFLATEDESIRKALSDYYGNRIYTIDIQRLNPNETWYESDTFLSDKKKSGIEYCVEIGILSRCNAMIASESQGTMAAMIMNAGSYEFIHLINEGKIYS